ncbi:MAG: leucyl aminopeptidase, partial [Candidatus Omnitrophica bacterium CG11_big_fil_rev_8_21_14_0_20_45_26]
MEIKASFIDQKRARANFFILGLFDGDKSAPKSLSMLDSAAHHVLQESLQKKRFTGKPGAKLPIYGTSQFKSTDDLLVVGLGKREQFSTEKLRRTAGGFLSQAKCQRAGQVAVLMDSFVGGSVRWQDAFEAVSDALGLADYVFDRYKSKPKDEPKKEIQTVELIYGKKDQRKTAELALERTEIISRAVTFTRNLANEPANVMTPRAFAEEARKMASKQKLKITVFKEPDLKRMKMVGILAVCQGSVERPHMVVLEYGTPYKSKGTLALVGKGVCFDTGGISIKPSKAMEEMKYDMCGAAAVTGIMHAIAELKPKRHIVAVAPLVENMPSGSAQRPGDIITYRNGKSAEVINTDAEGRLILADALLYACETYKPQALVDFATLTGACLVALADKASGLLGNDPVLINRIRKAGEQTGERCWELPMWEDFDDMIKGHHSDILNVGSGGGGTITAA